MCYFITIGLPEGKARFLEEHIPRGFHIAPIANRSVLEQMGKGFRTYLLMSGGCSCSLFHAPENFNTEESRQERYLAKQEHLRRKYQKQGWSAAKIERTLGQRPHNHYPAGASGLSGEVQRFLGELARDVGQVAVVVHWYDENLQDSQLSFAQGKTVPSETALAGAMSIQPDEIVWIKVS